MYMCVCVVCVCMLQTDSKKQNEAFAFYLDVYLRVYVYERACVWLPETNTETNYARKTHENHTLNDVKWIQTYL